MRAVWGIECTQGAVDGRAEMYGFGRARAAPALSKTGHQLTRAAPRWGGESHRTRGGSHRSLYGSGKVTWARGSVVVTAAPHGTHDRTDHTDAHRDSHSAPAHAVIRTATRLPKVKAAHSTHKAKAQRTHAHL